jgi:hypothetical protein
VTFCFDSNLTVGWTKHGGDDAVHVSVDLINLFADKKANLGK